MKRIVIESPLKGDRELNKLYARCCALHCLLRGEAPYASHLFFDHEDLLDDTILQQRELGIAAGFAWGAAAELRVFYLDLGESEGMTRARVKFAEDTIEDRSLFLGERFGDGWLFSECPQDLKYALLHSWRDRRQKQLGKIAR